MFRFLQALRCLALLGLISAALPALAVSYVAKADTFSWESTNSAALSWDKTCTSYQGDDDKSTINFTGGFTFRFAGTNYSSVRVLSNGGLQFGADTGFHRVYSNSTLPAAAAGSGASGCVAGASTNLMLAYWDDLNPVASGSGGVTWQQKGTAPNRYVVVSWNAVYQYGTSTPYTFQIILYESVLFANGEFKYQYGNANASGSSATIGVQVSTTDYTLYAYNTGYNANGSAVRWTTPNTLPRKIAEYFFDEYSYTGAVGEVKDNTDNDNHGTRVGTASSDAGGYVCRGLRIPSNTTNASNGFDTSIQVSSAVGESGSISMWVKTSTAWASTTAMLFDATTTAAKPFFLSLTNGVLKFSYTDSNGVVVSVSSAKQTIAADTWTNVEVTWKLTGGSLASYAKVFVNVDNSWTANGSTTGTLDPNVGNLFFGDNRSALTPSGGNVTALAGVIDDVRIYNYELSALQFKLDLNSSHICLPPPLDHIEVVPSTTSASTCAPLAVTVKACSNAACTTLLSDYTGTVNLSTSTNRGVWAKGSSPTPGGSLSASNLGAASYTFVAGDGGQAQLTLANSVQQTLTATGVDSSTPSTSRTSAAITFNDNIFTFSEDAASKVTGSWIAVAGRPHDITVTYTRRDTSTGECGAATDYTGSRSLKLWRTDSGGPWTAPTVGGQSIPTSEPGSANVTVTFSNGVGSFNLDSTDIGAYSLTLADKTRSPASADITSITPALTVRPFYVIIHSIKQGAVNNPAGIDTTTPAFAAAGSGFQLSVGGYRWAAIMETNGTVAAGMVPSTSASLAQVTAGGLAPSFGSTASGTQVKLSALANSQLPASGVLGGFGVLSGGAISNGATLTGFSGGNLTPTLAYGEVGSFTLSTATVVTAFLGNATLNLAALVYDASGTRMSTPRVGRFVPAGFSVSGGAVTHRTAAACNPASSFSYIGENFQLAYTLTARNALGATTSNYTGSFARLDLTAPASLGLAGIDGTTMFSPTVVSSTGTWTNGVSSNASLIAAVSRGNTAVGPFASAQFGILPTDPDGVALASGQANLDTSSPANTADRALLATVPLRYGRLRLQNAIGSDAIALRLPLLAQFFNGSEFITNVDDSCTRINASNLSIGNYTKTLTAASTPAPTGNWTVTGGAARVLLPAPTGGTYGSYDLAINLAPGVSEASCLAPWTPGRAATAGANQAFLSGAWCGASNDKHPAARATWGSYRGTNTQIYQRRNF